MKFFDFFSPKNSEKFPLRAFQQAYLCQLLSEHVGFTHKRKENEFRFQPAPKLENRLTRSGAMIKSRFSLSRCKVEHPFDLEVDFLTANFLARSPKCLPSLEIPKGPQGTFGKTYKKKKLGIIVFFCLSCSFFHCLFCFFVAFSV